MAHPLPITVTQSIKELRALQRQHGELIGKRLHVLIGNGSTSFLMGKGLVYHDKIG